MKSPFCLIILLNLIAVGLVTVGFFVQSPDVSESSDQQILECGHVQQKVRLKNLVLVVLDAFRDEFFFKYNAMHRIRKLVKDGDAVAFRTQVYYPTVTMPRIKSIISGSISTYSDLIMNFASSTFAGDNILTMAKKAQKRILFYGDDTWLSMLPNDIFEARSEGVSSFYVMDYTEVDNNVTRHLDYELSPTGLESWDIMTLHYLGLDHVGHSLGGNHPQIRLKLEEMDQILYNMTRTIARYRTIPGEFAIVVLGDHGMTPDGGHGGSSAAETRVPAIVIKSDGSDSGKSNRSNRIKRGQYSEAMKESYNTEKTANTDEINPADLIEQVDIAPTLCALLDFDRLPAPNFGISFHPQIEPDKKFAATKLESNIRQFHQHLSRLSSNFPSQQLEQYKYSLDACLERITQLCQDHAEINNATYTEILESCHHAMRDVQREVIAKITSSAEENYVPFSIVLSSLVLVLSVIHSFGVKLQRFKLNVFMLVFLQPILMFSSSFVEQEHDIWYFLFPLFVTKMLCDDSSVVYGILGRTLYARKLLSFVVRERWLLAALVLHRLGHAASDAKCRRWLLFADEKMIDLGLGPFTAEHFQNFFGAVIPSSDIQIVIVIIKVVLLNMALIWRNVRSLRIHSIPAALGFIAVFFCKLPIELKIIYIQRAIQLILLWLFITRNFASAFSLYVVFLMRPSFLPLYLLCWALGFAVGKIRLARATDAAFLLLSAINCAFYYIGNTISVASIDIAPGYTGLPFYFPAMVGLQILINTYAGPICVLLGWYQSTSDPPALAMTSSGAARVHDVLPALLTQRCAALLAVLTASYYFRHHLFVWTVFTPRLLYEVVHFTVFALFLAGVLTFAPKHDVKSF